MSMIKAENLTFAYPSSYDLIFENVNFQIDTNWRLGFVGRNGRGKTTLFKLLLGEYEYLGKISHSVTFDYFPYPISDSTQMTADILMDISPQAEEWELLREFTQLEVDPEVLWRPFQTLSNGEQTKVLLAARFLNEGHFLLIDEPTNHLDTTARQAVAAYLKKKTGFILVSHDRYFLDECVDHILALNRTTIQVQSGNFSTWLENFERQQDSEVAQNERLKKDIARLRQSALRSAHWSDAVEKSKNGTRSSGSKIDKGYVGHKAAKMMKRSKSIAARQQQAIVQKSALLKDRETAAQLTIHPLVYHTDLLVSFSNISILYDGIPICEPISFEIHQGDRILIAGKNGSGKSSLLKLVSHIPIEHRGTVTIGSGLVISYVPQNTSHLRGSLSEFARQSKIDESLFKTILYKMAFERTQFEKNMQDYSEGQKKKVLIAKSLCEKAHLYVWDEPLNFIDIYSRMQIEQLIAECSPTMLLAEHDAAFQQNTATKIVTCCRC
ncbi:MAG: ABC-F type ribosomal protection protein [Butyricicoccus pullicaecorum]|nr:ABC-F type ribosomal protection protein [Butyricicoccus pullicaecorum]